MSATEELRRMLDERGVEWRDSSDENVLHTTWNNLNCWFNEFPDGWTSWGMSMRGTPEQAIAATLGEVRAGSSRFEMTAEQVREAIERNFTKVAVIDDGGEKVEWREGWVCNVGFNSQAIADELNRLQAASETCRIEWRDESHDTDAGYERDGAYFCTKCRADLPYPLQECWDDYQALVADYGNVPPWDEKPFRCCPNCGAKVVDE